MREAQARVLLVDDDPVFTGAMSRGFVRRGYDVRTCHSASDALKECADWQPDCIVLDLNMPGTSGLLVLPELLHACPEARLVVLTGYSSIATAVEATKAGARNYLCKPATVEEVLQALGEIELPEQPVQVSSAPLSVDRLEWEHIQKVLQDNDGNISATARALNMHRRTLQRKLQKRPVKH